MVVQLIMSRAKEGSHEAQALYDMVYEKFETEGCLDRIENLQFVADNQLIRSLAEQIVIQNSPEGIIEQNAPTQTENIQRFII